VTVNFIIGFFAGSVSIISEAIHTLFDLLAAVMAFFSVKVADNPPDKKHPYGHGKFENVSGVIEALLIVGASAWIIYEAILKLLVTHSIEDAGLGLGFLVMAFAAILNFFVSRHLYKVARETDSVALEADALHLKTHIYTAAGIAVAMVVIYFTRLYWLDSVAAIIVALLILWEAFLILRNAFRPLIDTNLPEEDLSLIRQGIEKFMVSGITYHQLRTRKAGSYKFADFHLELPEDFSVRRSHDLCDRIERAIEEKIPGIEITIHVEPKDIHG
jgi:cation diffusion facilitator family transporter